MSNFISATKEFNTIKNHVNAPLFRGVFTCENKPAVSSLTICGLGFYRAFINGTEITKGLLAPYISNPNHYVYYDFYDVAPYLKIGKNVLGVVLGNGLQNCNDGGIWNFESASWRSAPKLDCAIIADGKTILESGKSFKCAPSAITFDDYRAGERYDSRLYVPLWNTPDFDDSLWDSAEITEEPIGEKRLCTVQPIKVEKAIKVKEIIKTDGGFIYDFGETNAGIYKLKIKGVKGQKVSLTFGEIVNGGKLDLSNISFGARSIKDYVQHDEYVCGSDNLEEYCPSFTFHGYRYIFVEGITENQATEDLLIYLAAHSDIKSNGSFTCGYDMVNKIQDAVLRSDLSNFFYFPMDCPQREKNGWTADASLSAEQTLYNFDASLSLKEWLNSICKAQNEKGALPGIVPTDTWGYDWGNGPNWDGVLIELPYMIYKFSGDIEVLKKTAPFIDKYFDYLKTRLNENGLISFGLGDWCEAGTASEELFSTPVEVTDTITVINLLEKGAFMFGAVNSAEMKIKAEQFKEKLLACFRKVHVKDGVIDCKTQTAQAMGLYYGIFTKEEEKSAYVALKDYIKLKNNHFCVGVIGAKVLFEVLSQFGDTELALQLITCDSFPSYAYNINRGATTLWEAFHLLTDKVGEFKRVDGIERLLSLNHHFWGSVSAWFYKYLGGIEVNGYLNVTVQPQFIKQLKYAACEHDFADGKIAVKWNFKDEYVELEIECVNVSGEILLPQGFNFAGGHRKENLTNGTTKYRIKAI